MHNEIGILIKMGIALLICSMILFTVLVIDSSLRPFERQVVQTVSSASYDEDQLLRISSSNTPDPMPFTTAWKVINSNLQYLNTDSYEVWRQSRYISNYGSLQGWVELEEDTSEPGTFQVNFKVFDHATIDMLEPGASWA